MTLARSAEQTTGFSEGGQADDTHVQSARVTANIVETIEPALGAHCKRVAMLAKIIGAKMGLGRQELVNLEIAGLLHDMGKLSIPPQFKDVPFARLDEHVAEEVNVHTVFTRSLLAFCPAYSEAGVIIRSHLEHLDGTGHPDGLAEENIPVGSKILGVANAFDELIQHRFFTLEVFTSETMKEVFAFSHLKKYAGKHFDRGIVEILEKEVVGTIHDTRVESVTVERLEVGMITSTDIVTKDGELLIAAGVMLNQPQLLRIRTYYNLGMLGRNVSVSVQKAVKFK
ncbi:MAG: HD domain-containing protein [Nitrospinae bacterium]|nr:HD domain-containing protein [Nitrospinota bacterium]